MSNELPSHIQKKIYRYEPIELEGFMLHPVTVEQYDDFRYASVALGFMTQTLPVDLMSIPLLSAFYKMDFEKISNGERASGLWTSALVGIAMALRLSHGDETAADAVKRIEIHSDSNDPSRLKFIKFRVDGELIQTITPYQYADMRKIIAAQNGVEIPDELDNPELVKSEQDIASEKAPKLEYRIEDLVSAAAAFTGKEEAEIYGWPLLKLSRRLAAFRRVFDYMICGIGASQGTTWKGGNPAPHPWLDRKKGWSDAMMPIENFMRGAGVTAMQEAGVNLSSNGVNA